MVTGFGDLIGEVVAANRLPEVFRVRSLLDAGVAVAGSSDRPVAPGSPLRSIQSMVQRQSASGTVHGPQEQISPAEAVAAFTVGAARRPDREPQGHPRVPPGRRPNAAGR